MTRRSPGLTCHCKPAADPDEQLPADAPTLIEQRSGRERRAAKRRIGQDRRQALDAGVKAAYEDTMRDEENTR